MEKAKVVMQKCTTCLYGPLDEDQEPCRACIPGGTFAYWKATNPDSTNTCQAGLGLGRGIGHRVDVPTVKVESLSNEAENKTAEITRTCREARKLLEQIERECRERIDEKRRKVIKRLLEALKEIPKPTTALVTIPTDPLTCPIDDLERMTMALGHGKGRER